MDTTFGPGATHASLFIRDMNTEDCNPLMSLGPMPPTETSNDVSYEIECSHRQGPLRNKMMTVLKQPHVVGWWPE